MKLFFSPTSPYVRKVVVAARELGILDRLELVVTSASPVDSGAPIQGHNPLGKVPALLLDDGTVLFDSRVIAEYLDGQAGGAKLFPEGAARWPAIVLQALADGMLDAAILTRYEQVLRPAEKRWPEWVEGQMNKVVRGLDQLEQRWTGHLSGPLDIGCIAAGCALGYLDFRYPDLGWRAERPALASWYEGFAARPAMQATEPKG